MDEGEIGRAHHRVEVSTRLVIVQPPLSNPSTVYPLICKSIYEPKQWENDDKGQFANIFNQAVLEINPEHPVIVNLMKLHGEPGGDEAQETVEVYLILLP